MQRPPQWRNIVVLGGGGVGKSTLVIRLVMNHFCIEYDPTIEDSYRKIMKVDEQDAFLEILDTAGQEEYANLRDNWLRSGEFFVVVCSVQSENALEQVKHEAEQVKRVKDLDGPIPAFLVASKCDLPRKIPRDVMLAAAVSGGFMGYYETSSKTGDNVEELFADIHRRLQIMEHVSLIDRKQVAKKQLANLSGLTALLPWNWSKKARWNSTLKSLEYKEKHSARTAIAASGVEGRTDKDVDEFRFPEPQLIRSPVALYNDLRQLLLVKEGQELADVKLVGEDGGSYCACAVLRLLVLLVKRKKAAKVEGVNTEVLEWIYTDRLPPNLASETELLAENAGRVLGMPDLVQDAANMRMHKTRKIADSTIVAEQMKPALSSEMNTVSDVTFVVGQRTFRLHRAILWARSGWFRALLSEQWKSTDADSEIKTNSHRIQISSMSPDVFGAVIEYLYTSRATIPPELALDVLITGDMLSLPRLVQLAEFALQPVIDSGNGVPLYLAAEAYGAKQLSVLCRYWMAIDLHQAEAHEQWKEIAPLVREAVRKENERLRVEKARQQNERELRAKMPCLLMPIID